MCEHNSMAPPSRWCGEADWRNEDVHIITARSNVSSASPCLRAMEQGKKHCSMYHVFAIIIKQVYLGTNYVPRSHEFVGHEVVMVVITLKHFFFPLLPHVLIFLHWHLLLFGEK